MRIAYFDCFSGVSGDMILGALLDAGVDFKHLEHEVSKLKLKGYSLSKRRIRQKGLSATKFTVHLRRSGQKKALRHSLKDILALIRNSRLSSRVKDFSCRTFQLLAEAECKAHGRKRGKMHFHEVGDIDSIIDVVGAGVAFEYLGIEDIYLSSINVGSGRINVADGTLPVPAPATAILLQGLRAHSFGEGFELATPTGVGILKGFGCNSTELPEMDIEKVGCGAGSFNVKEHPNLLRVFLGEKRDSYERDTISIIQTNIDDMNPVGIQRILERLYEAGAVDAYFTTVHSKKDRIGLLLTVLTPLPVSSTLIKIIFEETPTLGLRIYQANRYKLKRSTRVVSTAYGGVKVKIASLGDQPLTVSPEYEDCRRLSKLKNIPFRRIYEEAKTKAIEKFKLKQKE